MRHYLPYIWFVCILFSNYGIQAQNTLIDSLKTQLELHPRVTEERIDILNDLAFEYIKADPEKGIELISTILWQSDSIGYTKGVFRATIHKGSGFWISGLYDDALKYYLQALSYNVNDEEGYEFLYNNIAETYKKKQQYDSAVSYLRKSWVIAEEKVESRIPPLLASNLAEVYMILENYDSAMHYYEMSLNFSIRDQYDRGKSYAFAGLGEIEYVNGNKKKAWELQKSAFNIRKEINDKRGLIQSYTTFGDYHLAEKKHAMALNHYDSALDIATSTNALDQIYALYFKKYELFKSQGQYEEANTNLEQYHSVKDSLESQNFISRIRTIKNSLQRDLHEAENGLLRAQQLENQRSIRIQILVILAISAVIIVLIFYIFRNYRKLHESRTDREKLEQLNKLILRKNDEIEKINKNLDNRLGNTNKMLAESQLIASLGSWEYELATEEMHWTAETYHQLGLKPGSVVPSMETFEKHTSPDTMEDLKSAIRRLYETKEKQEAQIEIITSLGERRVVALKFFPEIQNGELVRLYGTNLDITEQIEQEDQEKMIIQSLLSLSHKANLKEFRFDKFLEEVLLTASKTLEVSRASFWQFDPSMQVLVCTLLYDARENNFTSGQTLSGREFPEYFKTLSKERTINIDDVMNHETTEEFRNYMIDKNIFSQLDVQINNDGQLLGVLSFASTEKLRTWTFSDQRYAGSISDIISTAYSNYQNKRLEKEKSKLIEKLVRKNQNLSEFAYVISHNLREPVAQILGLTRVYNHPDSEPIKGEIFERIVKASAKLDHVIKDLSALLTEDEDDNFTIEEIQLDDMIARIEKELEEEIKIHQPILSKRFALNFTIVSNKSFIANILFHLISNSLKYKDPERELTIGIEAAIVEDFYEISIIDNGSGIDLDRFGDKLFKMYQHFHGADSGRGLGLYIVKNQVELLGGKISVSSKPGRGTKFTIQIPVNQIIEQQKSVLSTT